MYQHPEERIGAPSLEELSESGLGRCTLCHDIVDASELDEGICNFCLDRPANCRKCGVKTTLRMLSVDTETCEDCDENEYSLAAEH